VLNGTEYRFSPLTYNDIEELDNWVRFEYMRRVLTAIPKDAEKSDKELAMLIAQGRVVDMTWLSGTGAKLISSLPGMLKIAQLSLQKRNPELTTDKLREAILADKDAFTKLSAALQESAGQSKPFPAAAKAAVPTVSALP
jgi:hypothetical protein